MTAGGMELSAGGMELTAGGMELTARGMNLAARRMELASPRLWTICSPSLECRRGRRRSSNECSIHYIIMYSDPF